MIKHSLQPLSSFRGAAHPTERQANLLKCHRSNVQVITKATLCLLAISLITSSTLCIAQKPLAHWLLSKGHENYGLAETLLWTNAIGMNFDCLRIIWSGALRGWNDLIIPPAISLILMTLIGVPIGYGFAELSTTHATEIILWLRNITILLSAVLIGERCRSNIKKDKIKYTLVDNIGQSLFASVPEENDHSKPTESESASGVELRSMLTK